MTKRWVVHTRQPAAQKIADEFKIHPVIANMLLRRGLHEPSRISDFLNPSLESLKDPFGYRDVSKAVDRIRRAITGQEKILIYGDYDVDGITGSAVLYPVLRQLGADVEVYIPHRIEEGYGLNQASLEKLLKHKYRLVITVDNGITGVSQIRFLNEKHIDTIVVDHHVPKEELPPAYAIVSACVGQEAVDPDLAACGLAFKLAWALLGARKEAESYLDLVTLGTIADIAPVVGENRIFLKFGLPMLARSKRAGIQALLESAKISRYSLSYRDVAFGLGPRINASGRMSSPLHAFKLLTTEKVLEAQNLAQILEDGNRDRQRAESAAFESALEKVEQSAFKETDPVLVVESPDWHEGILGIVASRLAERYQKPSIVISLRNGFGKGSGRSIPHFSLFDCVIQCEDLLVNFGGHAQACGLTIREENIPNFRNRLNQITANQVKEKDMRRPLSIEAELPLSELSLELLQDLEKLAPFGPGNEKPLFLSRGVRMRGEAQKRGQDTLRCWMTDAEGKVTCEAIGFRMFSRWHASQGQKSLDIVYQPMRKAFNGIESIELALEDWRQANFSSGP